MNKIEKRLELVKKLIENPSQKCIEYDPKDFNYNGTMTFKSTTWRIAKVAQLLGSWVREREDGFILIKTVSSRKTCKNRMCINPNHMKKLPEPQPQSQPQPAPPKPTKMSKEAKIHLNSKIKHINSWQY